MKVVIDTNIWISSLIKDFSFIDFLDSRRETVMLSWSNDLFKEIAEISKRSKFNKYFDQKKSFELLTFIKSTGLVFNDVFKTSTFVNPKDEYLLDLCLHAKAEYLVSGDKALLALQQIGITQIISLAEFKQLVQ